MVKSTTKNQRTDTEMESNSPMCWEMEIKFYLKRETVLTQKVKLPVSIRVYKENITFGNTSRIFQVQLQYHKLPNKKIIQPDKIRPHKTLVSTRLFPTLPCLND